MTDFDLEKTLVSVNDSIANLHKEESNISYATKNVQLNSYYFFGKRNYFDSIINKFIDIKKNILNSKSNMDSILYDNIVKDLDRFINGLESSLSQIDIIIEKFRGKEEVNFEKLNASFIENKTNSTNLLSQLSKTKVLNNSQEKQKSATENIESDKYTKLNNSNEEIITTKNDNDQLLSKTDEHAVYEEIMIDDEPIYEESENEKKNPNTNMHELMEQVKYRTGEFYSHNLMETRINHQISLIENQIMVLENSAKIKDLISIEKLKAEKDSLEKYLEKFKSKTKNITVARDNLLYTNDKIIERKSQNLSELQQREYNSNLFNAVNKLNIFVTASYIKKIKDSNTKLKIHQRTAILNKFNNKYANISKLSSIKGVARGSVEKLKILKQQLINEVSNISKDFQQRETMGRTM